MKLNNFTEVKNWTALKNWVELSNAKELGPFGAIVSTLKWLLSLNTNLTATIGEDVDQNTASVKNVRVFDGTLGLVLQEVPAGVPISEGMRISFDTDEGATLGNEIITNGSFDNDTAGWTLQPGWTYDSGQQKCTSDGLTTNRLIQTGSPGDLIVGARYQKTFGVSGLTTGNVQPTIGNGLPIEGNVSTNGTHTITAIAIIDFQPAFFRAISGFDGSIDNVSTKQIMPVFLNSVSKVDSTKLTPSTTGPGGEEIFEVIDPWVDSQVVAAGGKRTDFVGAQCRYFSTVLGGTTSGTGVSDDIGVTDWIELANYNNIQKTPSGNGWLTHILSEPVATTQHLLNSDSPATQTTASLATGDYILWQDGSGSSDLTAGTATISTTGSATDGSPLTFTVTVSGTVTVTITGGPPDRFQLEGGSDRTSFILSGGTTEVRAADIFSSAQVIISDKFQFLLAMENFSAQTYLEDGTNAFTYTAGGSVQFSDGTNSVAWPVVPKHGDSLGINFNTGELLYNGVNVATNALISPNWSAITGGPNNIVRILEGNDLDLTSP